MPDVIDRVSSELCFPPEAIGFALAAAQKSYRKLRIKKRSGGFRILLQPAIETKMLQSWVALRILNHLPVHAISTGFEPGDSIVKNAQAHAESSYSVRIDIANFFPSIQLDDLLRVIERCQKLLPEWVGNKDVADFISKVCFDSNGRLPVGYPTSPRIANVVMHDTDLGLHSLVQMKPEVFGRAVLTRYADDFVFSTDRRGACARFVDEMRQYLGSVGSPKLSLNNDKTKFMSRRGGSTLVTGLRIKQDGQVGIHANYRDHLRLLLKLYTSKRLREADVPKLRGHLAFVEHADPALFTRLCYQYFAEIEALRAPAPLPSKPVQPSGVVPFSRAA